MEGAVPVRTGAIGAGGDPRAGELGSAVARLRRELAVHPADLPERAIAEDELAALAAMAASGTPEPPRLRYSLLVIAGAIGSVSALALALGAVRRAIDLFGELPPGRGRD
ncbi:DUF5955 family protein [Streptomyces palmae]|uniref:Uncharacterized protein n=1 Tax=Streptomyces palmae TaxID=1701085 RepID=A0A4Z0H8H8_9ACTN|nr:DUF5955 family protein [Streptomyces palmae]TGB12670.1 hypothetical protein E4099_10955 [Streptomyces palmae]